MNKILNLFIEVGPILHEKFYSGIPNVVVHLISELSKVKDIQLKFFHENTVISNQVVLEAVRTRRSTEFRKAEAKGSLTEGTLSDILKQSKVTNAAVFTNVRHGLPRMFDYELQIVYDLTPLVTPQYHHPDTVKFYGNTYKHEYEIADKLFCISDATKKDVELYLPNVKKDKISYSLLAGEKVSSEIETFYNEFAATLNVEPYVLVLGTIEPRKNLSIIFELFNKKPSILAEYKWVFCGKDGWLLNFKDLIDTLNDDCSAYLNNIVRLNYIEEFEKIALLRKAEFMIFPSLYEGFGLPVLEALKEGCPVVSSFSSSIPEAGGDVASYFDPTDVGSLNEAILSMQKEIAQNHAELKEKCIIHSKQYSWNAFAMDLIGEVKKEALPNA